MPSFSSSTSFTNLRLHRGRKCLTEEVKRTGCGNFVTENKKNLDLGPVCPRRKPQFYLKADSSKHTAPASNRDMTFKHAQVGSPFVNGQADAIAPGAIAKDFTAAVDGFSDDNDEYDLESPMVGFSSIPEAVEDIRHGKFVIAVDDESRENEGDLIMAASKVTPDAVAFIVRHGTGIVCVSMKEEDLERLQIPLMVNHKDNEDNQRTAFTVTVVRIYPTLLEKRMLYLIHHFS